MTRDPICGDPFEHHDYCCFCGVIMATTEPTWPFCSIDCAIRAETDDELDRSEWYREFVDRTNPYGEH